MPMTEGGPFTAVEYGIMLTQALIDVLQMIMKIQGLI
jgi:hypothetical protein